MIEEGFMEDLVSDTDIVLVETGSLMNTESRPKAQFPLWVVNCIIGGGIPLTLQTEFSGRPQSGKTTSAYQTLAKYLQENPDGIGLIIDTESSVDMKRLVAMGIDVKRVVRLPSISIENAFGNMFKMFKKLQKARESNPNLSIMVVFDSVSSGGTNKQHDAAQSGNSVLNAGSMMELPRILKQNTANVFPFIESLPILIVYINQVSTTGIGSYVTKVESGGGFGFSHNMQFSLVWGTPKDCYEDGFIIGTECDVAMKKSKISPKFIEIPCFINARNGGEIDEAASFMKYLQKSNVGLIKTGSWYNMNETMDNLIEKYKGRIDEERVQAYKGNIRRLDLERKIREDEELQYLLQIALIDFIDDKFPPQREINNDYQLELMNKSSIFKDVKGDIKDEETEQKESN